MEKAGHAPPRSKGAPVICLDPPTPMAFGGENRFDAHSGRATTLLAPPTGFWVKMACASLARTTATISAPHAKALVAQSANRVTYPVDLRLANSSKPT